MTPDYSQHHLFRSERPDLESLLLAQAEVRAAIALDIPWKDRYDLVFADRRAGAARESFERLLLDFDWADPDMDYEDDALAFSRALDARIAELAPLFALAFSAS